MVKSYGEYQASPIDLQISFHGDKPIYDPAMDLAKSIDIPIIHSSLKYFPAVNAALILRAAKQGYKYMGFLDDDCAIYEPTLCHQSMIEAFNAESLTWYWDHVRPVGATGPYGTYWRWLRYDNDMSPIQDSGPICQWSTGGCQIYSVKALMDTRHLWESVMINSQRFCDITLQLSVDIGKYSRNSFFHQRMDHNRSYGISTGIDEKWYIRSFKMIHNDYSFLEKSFVANNVNPVFLEQAKKLCLGDFKGISKYASKHGVNPSTWVIKPLRTKQADFSELFDIFDLQPILGLS
jgi:hypothetical protein